MSELRHDPILKRWVIIATERGLRPIEITEPPPKPKGKILACPFCQGNEDKTPGEIYAIRPPDTLPNTPGWELRVFPNKFPAVAIEGDLDRKGLGIYDTMRGVGAHEVIVETQHHDQGLSAIPVDKLTRMLEVFVARVIDLHQDKRFRYVLIFKNYGAAAGASIPHPHTQLIATPITPITIAQELESSHEHFMAKERCLFCDIINQEMVMGDRVVMANEHFVLMTPFASRFPFELVIYPRKHCHDFSQCPPPLLAELASFMREAFARIHKGLNDPAYNYMIHTTPNAVPRPGKPSYWTTLEYDFHWHIEIIPKLSTPAGFEWGSGMYINSTPPELAAKYLRELVLE